jgi:hypothetical protein
MDMRKEMSYDHGTEHYIKAKLSGVKLLLLDWK